MKDDASVMAGGEAVKKEKKTYKNLTAEEKAKILERNRQWLAANPQKRNEYARRLREKRKNNHKTRLLRLIADVRIEITRRRKENHDERMKVKWNPEAIVKRFQTELLDWIEQQLDDALTPAKRHNRRAAKLPHSGKKEDSNVLSENTRRRKTTDA